MAPLAVVRVVEVSLGVSAVGPGLVHSLPGSLLRDLGADVTRVQSKRSSTLDVGVEFARIWNRGKQVVEVDDDEPPAKAKTIIEELTRDTDVAFVAGGEHLIERRGLTCQAPAKADPRLVLARIRPGCNALGAMPDLELLVQARSGLLTQIRGQSLGLDDKET